MLTSAGQLSFWKTRACHYLLAVLQRNDEAVAQGVQVSERFLQVTQGVRVGHLRVPSFLHVLFGTSLPRLLNKMLDGLNGLARHLLADLHRQLDKEEGTTVRQTRPTLPVVVCLLRHS